MTEEDAFHAAIDATPDDATARLVFADWLQERGDPRASGYRAMGRLGRVPQFTVWVTDVNEGWHWQCGDDDGSLRTWCGESCPNILPRAWSNSLYDQHVHPTRRAAEDAAALAFARLSEADRESILAGAT